MRRETCQSATWAGVSADRKWRASLSVTWLLAAEPTGTRDTTSLLGGHDQSPPLALCVRWFEALARCAPYGRCQHSCPKWQKHDCLTKKLSNSMMLAAWARSYDHLPRCHFTCWTKMDALGTEKGWKLDLLHLCHESGSLSVFTGSHELGFSFWWAVTGGVPESHIHTLILMRQISSCQSKKLDFPSLCFKMYNQK